MSGHLARWRRLLLVALALLVAAGAVALLYRSELGAARARWQVPRLVLVTFDTLHVAFTGVHDPAVETTPGLLRLAAEGVVFDRAYTSVPITLPAHSGLLTGRNPAELGVMLNGHLVPDSAETLAEILAAAGYRTGAFVSLGVLDRAFRLDQGFEHYEDRLFAARNRSYLTADEVVDAAAAWVRERAEEPFFLWVHLSDPHEPYQSLGAPADARLSLDGEAIGEWNLAAKVGEWTRFTLPPGRHRLRWESLRPPRPDDTWETSLRVRFTKTTELGRWLAETELDLDAEHDLREPLTLELVNPSDEPQEVFHFFSGRLANPPRSEVLEQYPLEVAFADRQLGRLRALFGELGIAERTLWAVASDHGEGLFNHLILGHSDFVHEDQLRTLFMLAGPGVPAGRRVGEREALLEDMLPTLLDLMRLPAPAAATGRSRRPCWESDCEPRREWWGFGASIELDAVTSVAGYRWPYKTLWQPDPGSGCYDIAADPWERRNLCIAYSRDPSLMPEEVRALERRLASVRDELQSRIAEIGGVSLDPERERMLKSLGYLGN